MAAVHKALFGDRKKPFYGMNVASQKFTAGMPQNSSNAILNDLILVVLNFPN